jgi:ribosomal protein S18 acetylase RimI-like enzyme
MNIAELCELADRNAADAARLFAENEPGAVLDERHGTLLIASATPMSSLFHSAARRVDPTAEPRAVLAAVAAFGQEWQRDMALWLSAATDGDVVKVAEAAGMAHRFSLAGMAIQAAPSEGATPPEVELVRVSDPAGVADFARVHGELFEAAGRPFEGAAHFASAGVLLAPNVVGYVAYLDGRPAACAMVVHTGRVAGLFEVATSTDARRRGLGELVSRAATRAGFEFGAEAVVLQATALGEPVYQRIGFEKITEYGPCRVELAPDLA